VPAPNQALPPNKTAGKQADGCQLGTLSMARNGLVYFGSYLHELVSFSATCGLSLPQLSAGPLGRKTFKENSIS
jgi:hypothetical protein